jgi:hypothetical protein
MKSNTRTLLYADAGFYGKSVHTSSFSAELDRKTVTVIVLSSLPSSPLMAKPPGKIRSQATSLLRFEQQPPIALTKTTNA